LPNTVVRWFRKSSLRQSKAVCHLPRSSRTTLSPAVASSFATTPPPAPAPTITALTCLRAISSREFARPRRIDLLFTVHVVMRSAANRRIGKSDHLPARAIAVAAMAWIAVEPLHRVIDKQAEELGRGNLFPRFGGYLSLFHLSEQLDLVRLGEIGKVPGETNPAALIHGSDSRAVGVLQVPQRPTKLSVDEVHDPSPCSSRILVGRDDLIADRRQGSRLLHSQKTPWRFRAIAGDTRAAGCRSGESGLYKVAPAEFVGWCHS